MNQNNPRMKAVVFFVMACFGVGLSGVITKDERHPVHKRAAPPAPPRIYPDWQQRGQDALKRALDWKPTVKPAKNVIFFLADGMGVSTQTAARFFKAQYEDKKPITETSFSWEAFPTIGLINTYSMDLQATDSSSAATAFLCGEKARTGMICVNQNVERGDCNASLTNKLKSLVHYALEEDKWTGVVSTALITDATPATTYAHSPERKWYNDGDIAPADKENCWDIARQLVDLEVNKKLKVVLGGGRRDFLPMNFTDPENGKSGLREDGRSLPEDWVKQKLAMGVDAQKVHYVDKKSDFDAIDPATEEYLLGLFEYYDMKYELDRRLETGAWQEPSLADMTEKSLKMLQRGPKGYFLFVEAGRIDHAHHDNEAHRSLVDVIALDDAVKKALSMVSLEDTLVVMSSDHDHPFSQVEAVLEDDIMGKSTLLGGGPHLGMDEKPFAILSYVNGPGFLDHRTENKDITKQIERINLTNVDTTANHFRYDTPIPRSSSTHSAADVTIYAAGPMAHLFAGQNEQSYIAHAIKYIGCLGENKALCNSPPPNPTGGTGRVWATVWLLVASLVVRFF